MSSKIVRDPLYNYISIDLKRDEWLLRLVDCCEFQRLRRIHQLGVSFLTYPGADHSRLSHSLGVLHLMQQAVERLQQVCEDSQVRRAREPLLAAALLHDVGHGPFSHLFEPCLGIDHERWSTAILLNEETEVHRVLRTLDRSLPQTVANLIDKDSTVQPAWQKYLLSSQLDMDRLDYLRRDSLFTGAGYGHFDWFRLLSTFELHGHNEDREIVWPEKAKLAIEEYIFARYYMYQNVYLHKTTRGFERLIEAMWKRARALAADGTDLSLVPSITEFWATENPTVQHYLAIEEFSVLQQIQNWTTHKDRALADLARRFLSRQRFSSIDPPRRHDDLAPPTEDWELALQRLVGSRSEFQPAEMYCLADRVKGKYYQPYFGEKQGDEQSAKISIRLKISGEPEPIEISKVLDRLNPVIQEPIGHVRYYIPKEVLPEALKLRERIERERD